MLVLIDGRYSGPGTRQGARDLGIRQPRLHSWGIWAPVWAADTRQGCPEQRKPEAAPGEPGREHIPPRAHTHEHTLSDQRARKPLEDSSENWKDPKVRIEGPCARCPTGVRPTLFFRAQCVHCELRPGDRRGAAFPVWGERCSHTLLAEVTATEKVRDRGEQSAHRPSRGARRLQREKAGLRLQGERQGPLSALPGLRALCAHGREGGRGGPQGGGRRV